MGFYNASFPQVCPRYSTRESWHRLGSDIYSRLPPNLQPEIRSRLGNYGQMGHPAKYIDTSDFKSDFTNIFGQEAIPLLMA